MSENSQHKPLRVLVVDDCRDTTESLSMLLRLWGHFPYPAHDGPTALCEAARISPDVVLLDIGLPGLSGWEVATRLRKQPGTEKVLLVAMSGYGSSHDQTKSRDAGCDLHLLKPVAPDLLQRLLADQSSRESSCAGEVQRVTTQEKVSGNGEECSRREIVCDDKLVDVQGR